MVGDDAGGCGELLRELEQVWVDIGESEAEKQRVLADIEMECLSVYRRKVDEACRFRAQLHQSLAAKEAEMAALVATLGKTMANKKMDRRAVPLKEQLAHVEPLLEDLRNEKEERMKQFSEVCSQIQRIHSEISEYGSKPETIGIYVVDEHNLSIAKLNECQTRLHALQKEKSDRLQKVLNRINEVHLLCGVLGIDFGKTLNEVHPSLQETSSQQSANISDCTLEGLANTVSKLIVERRSRIAKLRETKESLTELWNLMDITEEERKPFARLLNIVNSPEENITSSGALSQEVINQMQAEVDRLMKLKSTRLKELVLKRRLDLEDICRKAHLEPDTSTSQEKTNALIDSGLVDPAQLLESIDSQIELVKEESTSRKEIMDRIDKWLAACDEEGWLEEYNQDQNRYSAGRGAHLNLKRAEKARIAVTKIPGMVDNLMARTFAWEDERNKPFLYDGARLVCILEEYKLTRQQREEEKRRYQEHKKLQNLLNTKKEAIFGSKPSPKRTNSNLGRRNSGAENGPMTPTPRRASVSGGTPDLLTPRSYSARYDGYFKDSRRISTVPINFVALPKEDSVSTFTSISGSEPESPSLG